MKKILLLALASAGLTIGCSANLNNVNNEKEERDAKIIVKLKDSANQKNVLREISSEITGNYKVIDRYKEAFNGFSMEVPAKYVDSIRSLERVSQVDYDHIVMDMPNSFDDGYKYEIDVKAIKTNTASSQTMSKPEGTNEGANTFIAILDNGFYLGYDEDGNEFHHNVFSPLNEEDAYITQASLREKIDAAETFHGKYDAEHSTYFNNKVPFFYDYGGDKAGTPVPDYDVYAEGQDHGTHVASIAAGNAGSEYEGIAPRAQLALMKVFITYMSGQQYVSGGAPETAILSALEDCLVLDVDVINMSLGSNLDDFDEGSIANKTIKRLVEKGSFLSISNGNEGRAQYDTYCIDKYTSDTVESNIIGSYANNPASMSIAANQADYQFYGEALRIGDHFLQYADEVTNYNSVDGPVTYNPERHLKDIVTEYGKTEFDYVYTGGLGGEEDYLNVDVTGKIVVVNRGDLTFREKVENATNHGAIALAIIDNTGSTTFNIRMSFGDDGFTPAIPVVFFLTREKEYFDQANTNVLEFIIDQDLDNPNTRTPSDFSSDGMKYDLTIKPEISTPGENIKGAVLGAVDKYESMSGTSMAAPNYAGALALVLSEHVGDASYRPTVNSRLMSTADPMLDTIQDATYASVRKQGAGLVNLERALSSEVYLDGIGESNSRLNKAKIELKNNSDIAAGRVNLSFWGINESSSDAHYIAHTYVLAPEVATFNTETYKDFSTNPMITAHSQLVEVFEDNITIPTGASIIDLPDHELSELNQYKLNAQFPSGVVLDGYVILEPVDNGYEQLSIPFLGFYGDYSAAPAVEPFNFEKDPNYTYDSDILNYFVTKNLGKNESQGFDYTNASWSSYMVAGYWSDESKISSSTSGIAENSTNIYSVKDENGNTVKPVGLNMVTGEYDLDRIYIPNNQYSNAILIQLFVLRSCANNSITIKSKATGEVVNTSYVYDYIRGSEYDSETGTHYYPLSKSFFNSDWLDSGYIADRAFGAFMLQDKDGNALSDGDYTIEFNFELLSGGSYSRSYEVTLVSALPTIKSVEKVNVSGTASYKIIYNDLFTDEVTIGGETYPVTKDGDIAYVTIPTATASSSLVVKSRDAFGSEEEYFAHLSDKNFVMLNHPFLLNNTGYDYSYSITKSGNQNQLLQFSFTKNGSATSAVTGTIKYKLIPPTGIDIGTLHVYTVNGSVEKEISYEVEGRFITFSTGIKKIRLTSDAPKTLSSIAVDESTVKTFNVGDSFINPIVTATYSDTSTSDVSSSVTLLCTGYDMSKAGTQTVSVSYTENGTTKKTTYSITVNAVNKLSSISVSGQKTEFEYGEIFSFDGVVTASYTVDPDQVVNPTSVSIIDTFTSGVKHVTVTYIEDGVTATYTYDVTVNEPPVVPTSLDLTGMTVDYVTYDDFSFDGIARVNYSDHTVSQVTPTSVSTPDMTVAGDKEITVTYVEDNVTLTKTYVIHVAERTILPASLVISGQKIEFTVGDAFSFDGTCTLKYTDDSTEVVTPVVSAPDMSSAGTKTVTLTYTKYGVTVTATYNITVSEAPAPTPTPEPEPTPEKKGCGGSVATTSVIVSALAISLALLLTIASKRKED